MSWTRFLVNPEAISAIYGEAAPSLDRVKIHEIRIDLQRGILVIRIDLGGFPSLPPKKWLQSGFNAVQVEFQAAEVRSLELQGDISGIPQDGVLTLKGDGFMEIAMESERLTFSCKASALHLTKISAYQDTMQGL